MEKITKHQKTIVKDVSTKGLITLQISQFDKYDSDNDRMMKGAFTKTFKEGKQVHLVDHKVGTSTYVGLPVKKDPDTLTIESQLNLNKQIAKDLLSDYEFSLEHGRSLQHSQGFLRVKDKYKENEKGGFDYHEVSMFEYSTVVFGAESATPVHSIKSEKDMIDWIEALEKRLKFGFMSDQRGKNIEEHINQIKVLLKEPSRGTQSEPAAAKALQSNQFFNNLI